jgi:KilA-N domain
MTALTLTIDGIAVRQDDQGRYRLNDLHKAAGGELRHKPSEWLRNKQVHELVQEILDFKTKAGFTSLEQIQPLNVIKGGSNPGIFAAKELVYAYAMWISAKFHLAVIHAYDALVSQPSVHQLLADPATLDALAERIAQRLPGTTSPYSPPPIALPCLATRFLKKIWCCSMYHQSWKLALSPSVFTAISG